MEVDLHHGLIVGVGYRGQRAPGERHPGVGDQNVEPAELVESFPDERRELIAIASCERKRP
jgi:hypothetical protein